MRRPIDGKNLVDFESLDGLSARNDGLERGAEFGNIPLAFAELMELPPDRILWRDFECLAEGAICKADSQIGLEHEKSFADRLHDIQWNDFAHCDGSAGPQIR